MRKTLLSACFLVAGFVQAQNDAVTNAFFFNKDGELDKAKEEIDRAASHEKTKDKPKTWYFRGKIYHNLFTSKVPKFKVFQEGSGQQAYESFSKSKSLSKAGDEYYELSSQDLRVLFGDAFNKGIAEINFGDSLQRSSNKEESEKLFSQAFANFMLSNQISSSDTSSIQNAFICATRLKDYSKAEVAFNILEKLSKVDPTHFTTLSKFASNVKPETSLAWLEKGISKYPDNANLRLLEIEWYFSNGRGNEVKSKLEDALRLDSTNAGIYAILGNIYEQEAADAKRLPKDRDASKTKAINSYKKAVQIDPGNIESNFNLGVYYFNKAVDILKKVDNMDINTYQKKGKAMEADAKKEFSNALPFFEACYKKEPNDPGVRKSLKNTYIRLERPADAEKIPD